MNSDRVALVIGGMHRSGTSALARTFALLGASLPADLVPPNEGNPKGHWEPEHIVSLNDAMLADVGSDIYSLIPFDRAWFTSGKAMEYVERAEATIADQYGKKSLIVIKDPRVSLFLPIWDAALSRLGYLPRYVLPLRSPNDVANSLSRRHLKTIPYDAWPSPRGQLTWMRYTVDVEAHTREKSRCLLLFDRFMADWKKECSRVSAKLEFQWPRQGPIVDREISEFLAGDAVTGQKQQPKLAEEIQHLAHANSVQLAQSLYHTLCPAAVGDETLNESRVDRVANEFRTRADGSSDIISALESNYALIWKYFNDSKLQTDVSALAQSRQERLHEAVHTLWEQLTSASSQHSALSQDLLNTNLQKNEFSNALDAVGAALTDVNEHNSRLRAELASTQQAQQAQLAAIQQVQQAQLEALQAQLEAIHKSTSWRITAPIRYLASRLRVR